MEKEIHPALLFEKSKVLAKEIAFWSATSTTELLKELKLDDQGDRTRNFSKEVMLETAIFFFHLTDRVVNNLLRSDQHHLFMSSLLNELKPYFLGHIPTGGEDALIDSVFTEVLNARQKEYSGYRVQNNGDDSLKNTLFWEFDKRIMRTLEKQDDAFIMMTIDTCIVTTFKALNIPGIFK